MISNFEVDDSKSKNERSFNGRLCLDAVLLRISSVCVRKMKELIVLRHIEKQEEGRKY